MLMDELELKYDILSIQERLKERKAKGVSVVNGCAGMLFDESGELVKYDRVVTYIKKNLDRHLGYPATVGSSQFAEGALKWLFKDFYKRINKLHHVEFVTTIGGTGALSACFHDFSDDGAIAISDICWPNYYTIAEENKVPIQTYNMFIINKSDLVAMKNLLDDLVQEYKKVLLVINDPCHNPTGYCMSETEYITMMNIIESYKGKVSVLFDVAYIDYSPFPYHLFKLLSRKKYSFDTFIAFSCSKSFGLYGARVGGLAMILDHSNKSIVQKYKIYARGTISCPNGAVAGPIEKFFESHTATKLVWSEIKRYQALIAKRAEKFLKCLDDLHIRYVPYSAGFFMIFKTEDAYEMCKKLEELDIYFAPIDKTHIRVALSGMTLKEIDLFKERMLKLNA